MLNCDITIEGVGTRSPLTGLVKENAMTERQQEAWAGVLLTALILGLMFGAWLMLRHLR